MRATLRRLRRQGVTAEQFLFQMLVVTVGVYVAIVIQGRVERGESMDAASKMLRLVDQELAADQVSIAEILNTELSGQEALRQVADAALLAPSSDTTIRRLLTPGHLQNRSFFYRRAAYSMLLNGGQLRYINDEQLRLELAQIYEHDYVRLALNGEVKDRIFQDVFRASLLGYWHYAEDRSIGTHPDAAIALSNGAHRAREFSSYYCDLLRRELAALTHARETIAAYLGEN